MDFSRIQSIFLNIKNNIQENEKIEEIEIQLFLNKFKNFIEEHNKNIDEKYNQEYQNHKNIFLNNIKSWNNLKNIFNNDAIILFEEEEEL